MSGSWQPPVFSLEIAALSGPFDTVGPSDWVDVSDRLRSWSFKRGRRETTESFQVGTFAAVLDNSDGYIVSVPMSPSNPNGVLLPYCPVRFTATWEGSDYVLFAGYLGPDCLEREWGHGSSTVISIDAVDRLGWLMALQSRSTSVWDAICGYLDPDWWVTGDAGFPALGDGVEIPNMSPEGGSAVVVASGSDIVWAAPVSGSPAGNRPAMRLDPSVTVKAPSAQVMPHGDELDMTFALLWGADAASTSDQDILTVKSSAGTKRLQVVCTSSGDITMRIYDSGGSLLDSATVQPSDLPDYTAGDRFDDGSQSLVVVRIDGGTEALLSVKGHGEATSTPLDKVRQSDVVLGGSDQTTTFEQLQIWRRRLSDEELSVPTIYVGAGLGPWRHDTLSQRVDHWYDVFAVPNDATVHVGADDSTYADQGMFEITSNAASLGWALRSTVESWGGAVWATRDGGIRVRSMTALDNPAHAADYATVVASFTDEASPAATPLPLRRGRIKVTGPRLEKVVNEATVSFLYAADDADFAAPITVDLTKTSPESRARFGRRTNALSTTVADWAWAALLAQDQIDRFASPPVEISEVPLFPVGDNDVTGWLLDTCELEKAVQVVVTPKNNPFGTTVTFPGRIQGEQWAGGDGLGLAVSLYVA